MPSRKIRGLPRVKTGAKFLVIKEKKGTFIVRRLRKKAPVKRRK